MRTVRARQVCAAVLLCLAGSRLPVARAADLAVWAGGSEPIQIHSQSLEARADEGLVLFRGEVVAQQGDLTLQADEVTATFDKEAQQIRAVEASGNIRIQRQDLTATGRAATFDVVSGELTLSGDAKAWRGRNVVAGERIILYLADKRMEVKGDAKMYLVPQEPPTRP